ncbi:MAG: septal ring lytic transglycosylase RlpA family protein [Treponema sp.]|nr:septal ring lytic transglycosylase RlpA family protein [Treponema sp.]
MKTRILFFIITALLFFQSSSPWEGAAGIASDGELPASGFFVATNSFPRNSVVDITNIENGRTIRVVVANTLNSPGLLAIVSREAAEFIGMRSGSISRIRMLSPSDPIAYQRFNERISQEPVRPESEPVIKSEEELISEFYRADAYDPNEPLPPVRNEFTGPSYIVEPEWGGEGRVEIVELPHFDEEAFTDTTEVVEAEKEETILVVELIEEKIDIAEAVEEEEIIEIAEVTEEYFEEIIEIVEAEEEEEFVEIIEIVQVIEEEYFEEIIELVEAEEEEEFEEIIEIVELIEEEEFEEIIEIVEAEEEEELVEIIEIVEHIEEEEFEEIIEIVEAEEEEEFEEIIVIVELIEEEEFEEIIELVEAEEEEEFEEIIEIVEHIEEEEFEEIIEIVEVIEEEEFEEIIEIVEAEEEEFEEIIEIVEVIEEEEFEEIIELVEVIEEELEEIIEIVEVIEEEELEEIIELAEHRQELVPVEASELTPSERSNVTINPEDIIPGIVSTTPQESTPADSSAEPAFSIRTIPRLERGLYYVQIASLTEDLVENTIKKIDLRYDPVIFKDKDRDRYQILIGPLNQGESAAIRSRFISFGYRDAFVRRGT